MALQKLVCILAAGGMAVALSACDESEQGRVLRYEKGTYLGKPDTGLSDAERAALRSRVQLQGG